MPGASAKLIELLLYLFPGFISAWIFYGLTAHAKPPPFERVVQSLVFTMIIQAALAPLRWLDSYCGWSLESHTWLFFSVPLAFVWGIVLVWTANNDSVHNWFRKIGMTSRIASPSEWNKIFSREQRIVYLHLDDEYERRIKGWPEMWPDSSDVGHFVLTNASWIHKDNTESELATISRIIIPVSSVRMVEMEKRYEEILVSIDLIEETNKKIVALNKEAEEEKKQEVDSDERLSGSGGELEASPRGNQRSFSQESRIQGPERAAGRQDRRERSEPASDASRGASDSSPSPSSEEVKPGD